MRRNWNGGIFFKSLTCMKESVMLRRFIIAIATVAALGISFSSTDASAQKGVHGSGTRMGGPGLASRGTRMGGPGLASRGTRMGGPGIAPRGYAYRGGYGGPYSGGGYGGGWGYYGGGLAAGAILGGLYDGYGYDGYGYDGYGYDGYGDVDAYAYEAPVDDSAVAYCVQRFRSYDPASGTYLGNDGYRHPCP